MSLQKVILLFLSTGLIACGTGQSALRLQARDDFFKGNFKEAEKKIITPAVVGETKNRFLTLVELASIAHYQGDLEKSNIFFFQAEKLAQRLYTESIREKAASLLLNNNAISYGGTDYERSLIYYYTVMNFILMSQGDHIPAWEMPEIREGKKVIFAKKLHKKRSLSKKEKAKMLSQASNQLLAWESFLSEVRRKNKGKPYYKDDLLNKTLAAYIYRMSNRSGDTSRILYNDAQKTLVRSYGAYPTFNKKSSQYVDKYGDFPKIGEKRVLKEYIQKTSYFETTKEAIQFSQKNLKKQKGNVLYVLEYGIVPIKKSKRYVIGLSTLFKNVKNAKLRAQLELLGLQAITVLAPDFGLVVTGATLIGDAVKRAKSKPKDKPVHLSDTTDQIIGFEFHLPTLEKDPTKYPLTLSFIREKDSKVIEKKIALMNPLNDIVELDINRKSTALAFETGVRVGLKYLAALVPTILLYNKIKGPKLLKALIATASWYAAKRIIDKSEAADVRAWNLLPKWIGLTEVDLPKGRYKVFINGGDEKENKKLFMGSVNIENEKVKKVLRGRIFTKDFLGDSSGDNIMN